MLNNKQKNNFRCIYNICFFACVSLLAAGYYVEYWLLIEPCILCLLQRFAYCSLGAIFLLGAIHNPGRTGCIIYNILGITFATSGALLAGRQIWLQSIPAEQLPSCIPSLEKLFKLNPFTEAITILLKGSAECGEITFRIFGLPVAYWSLAAFIGFIIMCIISLRSLKKPRFLFS